MANASLLRQKKGSLNPSKEIKYQTIFALFIALGCMTAAACGNKGNLYYPEQSLPAAQAPLPPQVSDEEQEKDKKATAPNQNQDTP